jgi:single-strand DNA-binding protein
MLRVSLLGNLGGEPEVRFTPKGTQIVMFRIAVNQVRTGPDGERQENTEWFRVRIGNPRFSEYAQRLTKGTRVLAIGRLDISHYQSKEGEPRVGYDVWADEIQAMSPRNAPEQDAAAGNDGDDELRVPAVAGAGVSSLSNGAGQVSASSRSSRAQPARRDRGADSSSPEDLEELPF